MAVPDRITHSDLGRMRVPNIYAVRGRSFKCSRCKTNRAASDLEDAPYVVGHETSEVWEWTCGTCSSVFALVDVEDDGEGLHLECTTAESEYRIGASSTSNIRLVADAQADDMPAVLRGYADSIENLAAAQAAVEAHAAEVLAVYSTREADRALKAAGIKSSRATINRQAQAHVERQVIHEIPEF